MHQVKIPASVVERVVARRGREHVYADFDPSRTALVVVDLQNAFMMPGVAHSPCQEALDIVPNVNRIARGLRAAGGAVVWIQTAFTEESLVSWSTFHDMSVPARTRKRSEALTPGSIGYALWSELEALPEDLYVEKLRFSAFIQGSSDLERILRDRGIDTVIITGTVTSVCCESTARDAMMRNFKTIMVTDGNAASTDDEHNAALIAFYLTFGDILPTDMICQRLEAMALAPAQ
ncbi:MAG: isochorismatase family cysteine hydrolase [Beijerinckiaceae bacterium]|nr:isochorismatase family cysteine hydrolase [Beijerinckiaceae bacterium]